MHETEQLDLAVALLLFIEGKLTELKRDPDFEDSDFLQGQFLACVCLKHKVKILAARTDLPGFRQSTDGYFRIEISPKICGGGAVLKTAGKVALGGSSHVPANNDAGRPIPVEAGTMVHQNVSGVAPYAAATHGRWK